MHKTHHRTGPAPARQRHLEAMPQSLAGNGRTRILVTLDPVVKVYHSAARSMEQTGAAYSPSGK